MTKTLTILLVLCAISGCQKILPFISDQMAKNRWDWDHDGIPRPDDCDDRNPDPKVSTHVFYRDIDHDGFGGNEKVIRCMKSEDLTEKTGDCNDGNAKIFPGVEEVCNNLDDDCNGKTDDNASDQKTWNEDKDQDTYGSTTVSKVACFAPPNFVVDHSDCHDDAKEIHPNEKELCDGIDNDCDEQTDENFSVGVKCDSNDSDLCKNGTLTCTADKLGTACVNESEENIVEKCDGLDNNCNGQTDENVQTVYYIDVDQDGYGNDLVTKMACDLPSGYTLDKTDCEDLDKEIHPEAKEKCNNIDDDCSGQTDEIFSVGATCDGVDSDLCQNGTLTCTGDKLGTECTNESIQNIVEICDNKKDDDCDGITDNAPNAKLWCEDKDKDGYGSCAVVSLYTCSTPTELVTDNTDCNDGNLNAHPNAQETCQNNIDDDCNGITDTDAKVVTWYLDGDGDTFGTSKNTKQDCKQPPGYVTNALDCNDANASINPDAKEICNNDIDDNCDDSVNQCKIAGVYAPGVAAQTKIYGNANNVTLDTIAIGDVNGDGKDDLIVGVKHDSSAGINTNAVYLFLGPVALGDISLDAADAKWIGAPNDQTGFSVSVGDANGDGMDDILVGARNANAGMGEIYLIMGSPNPTGDSLSKVKIKWMGQHFVDQAGTSVNLADMNGDGKDDILIGAPGYAGVNNESGAIYLILGSQNLVGGNLSSADAKWTGETKGDETAKLADNAGDINGDGKDDIVITSIMHGGQAGAIYLILGSSKPIGGSLSKADAIWSGEFSKDNAGHSAAIGDVNGDGKSDIVIGAPLNDTNGTNSGAVYLILGSVKPIGGSLSGAAAKWIGENANDLAGTSVGIGDLNKDGKSDILVGAPTYGKSLPYSGAVYLVLGTANPVGMNLSSATAKWVGEANSQLGRICSLNGDLNDDGFKDIIMISPYLDFKAVDNGMLYLIHSLNL